MATEQPLYQLLANLIEARNNCMSSCNSEWRDRHEDHIDTLVRSFMPSGSGFDSGTTIELDKSTPEKLVFHTSYHHMDEHGFYDGWTDHIVTVCPSLGRTISISISGKDRNQIKEYMYDVFHEALMAKVVQP